ncbi:MAG: hypothetical protein HY581_03775 [Nitrospirae bacterium]|nr:hypothetical protein [Nitrospirota bacterium]
MTGSTLAQPTSLLTGGRGFRLNRVLFTTLVAGLLMQAVMALLWMNPLTTQIILSPEFGQSQKLINVWTMWHPLPRITQQPSWPMIDGYLVFTFLHVLLYHRFASLLPGHTWVAKGLGLAIGIWLFQYGYFEFFTPFNQYWEPLHLIAYELLLQGIMAVVEGLAIARLYGVPQRSHE